MTSNEFRELMIGVFKMAISDIEESDRHGEYIEGYIGGLYEAIRKLDVAKFLTEEEKYNDR